MTEQNTQPIVEIRRLRKVFGDHVVLEIIDFEAAHAIEQCINFFL